MCSSNIVESHINTDSNMFATVLIESNQDFFLLQDSFVSFIYQTISYLPDISTHLILLS